MVWYPVWQHTFVSPSAFSRRVVVSYWWKYVHEVLVNHLGGLRLPRKSVARLTDRPNMTLDVYRGRKTTMQQQQQLPFLNQQKEKWKVCGQTGYWTQDLWLLSQMCYRLPHAALHINMAENHGVVPIYLQTTLICLSIGLKWKINVF